jgi:ABC-type proline/glycine betaine transport system ATPase subunit
MVQDFQLFPHRMAWQGFIYVPSLKKKYGKKDEKTGRRYAKEFGHYIEN